MTLNDNDLLERLKSPGNLVNRIIIHEQERGKRDVDTPIEIKKTIAILGNEGEIQQALADTFGLSRQTVNGYENARDRDSLAPDESLTEVVSETRARVEGRRVTAESQAVESVLKALEILPQELEAGDKKALKRAKAVSSIAKDTATVANMMGKRGDGRFGDEERKAIHVHLYRPLMAKITDYDVVDAEVVK